MFCDIADLLHVKLTKPFWNPTWKQSSIQWNLMDIDNFNILCACIYCTGCSSVKWMCWLLTIVVYLFCLFIKQVYFFKPKYSMLLIPLKAGDTSSPIRICNHIQHNIQVNKIAMILWFQVSFLSISLCMYNDFVIVPWQVLIYTFSDLYIPFVN